VVVGCELGHPGERLVKVYDMYCYFLRRNSLISCDAEMAGTTGNIGNKVTGQLMSFMITTTRTGSMPLGTDQSHLGIMLSLEAGDLAASCFLMMAAAAGLLMTQTLSRTSSTVLQ